MSDDEEFAARSQLKWQRDGNVWILLYRRKRMGRVVPDDHPGMWSSVKSNGRSDLANLSWAKDAVLAQAVRKVAYEQLANDPSKCPVKPGSQKAISSPVRFSEAAE